MKKVEGLLLNIARTRHYHKLGSLKYRSSLEKTEKSVKKGARPMPAAKHFPDVKM
jgi:hypothetical protein